MDIDEENLIEETTPIEEVKIEEESNNIEAISLDSDNEKVKPEKKEKKKRGFAKKACSLMLSGVLFGSCAGGALYGTDYLINKNLKKDNTKTEALANEESKAPVNNNLITSDKATESDAVNITANGEVMDVREIATNCLPSVVAITNVSVKEINSFFGNYTQDSVSAGSGVIIAKTDEELVILTNYHVVYGAKDLSVVFSYEEDAEEPTAYAAEIKGYDASKDIAVIGISIDDIDESVLDEIKIAVVGDSDKLVLGDQVVAIGNALGYGQSVTTGIVSALNRLVELQGEDGTMISNECIQTDAAINPGNSGGAMFNMKGELVGINSAKASSSNTEGMGYAIPITDIYDLVNNLIEQKTFNQDSQGYLCISGGDVDSTTASMYGVPQGVYVSEVYEGLAAANAGITSGDIITSIDGVEVKSMSELKEKLTHYEAGDKIEIIAVRLVDRTYEEKTFTVELSSYDDFQKLTEDKSTSNNSTPQGGSDDYNPNDIWDYFFNY